MVNETQIIPQMPTFGRRMYRTSYLILLSSYSAWYNNLVVCLALSLLVFITSVMYWSNPTNGWKRKLDMTCVMVSLIYQLCYLALWLDLEAYLAYLACITLMALYYGMARYYGRVLLDYDMSSRYHVGVHIVGNISNLVLYDALGVNYLGW
jgi:hypothetical protein